MKDKPIKKALKYILESKKYIFAIIFVFFTFVLIGFFFPDKFSFLDEQLKELINKTVGLKGIELIEFIFFNNIKSAFFGIIAGIFLGIIPIFTSILNGAVLGYVFAKVYQVSGFSEFWRILPHGIFELPAVFIALGIGLRLGFSLPPFISSFFRHYWKKNKMVSVFPFIASILPLLLLAFTISVSKTNFNILSLIFIPILFVFMFTFFFVINIVFMGFGCFILDKKFRKNHIIYEYFNNINNAFLVLFFVILPLLIIAAIIEGTLISLIK